MTAPVQLKNQHLLWRAGFGPAAGQLDDLNSKKPAQLVKDLFQTSKTQPHNYFNVADSALVSMYGDSMDPVKRAALTEADRKELGKLQRESVKKLNLHWLKEMINSPAQLKEKMAFFWHGHFASRNENIFFNQLLLDVLRKYGLGNFGTLLKEVSRSAAMLYFLNNQQNRKGHPNENFAREVMELFTLGRGNYTEADIKESARAFTGWTADRLGVFQFRPRLHDEGVKTFLGKKGNFTGDDILDIILEQKQTAIFIVQKLYRFFVNDPVDDQHVAWLAGRFYNSNYDITGLMQDIFLSDWFYDKANIGALIKPPVVLIAGIQRMIPMQLDNDNALMNLQRLLGQQLLYPPNVAGWPGGKSWIDSSTLMVRLRIPQMFNDKDQLNVKPKPDDDQMMGMQAIAQAPRPKKPGNAGAGLIQAKIDWEEYTHQFNTIKREDLLGTIAGCLVQVPMQTSLNQVAQYIDDTSKDAYIRSATIQIMSTPEYQLC